MPETSAVTVPASEPGIYAFHAYKLLPSHCRVNVRKGFFAERVAKPWNCLPAELHHFNSLSVFKSFVFSTGLSDFVMC